MNQLSIITFMKRVAGASLAWISAILLVCGPATQAAVTTQGPGFAGRGNLNVWVDGVANCNCTSSDANLTVCHVDKIDVLVGTQFINVNTGEANTNCASQDVPPGQCIYYRYNFACQPSWLWGWSCWPIANALKNRPVNDGDC